MTVEHKNVHIRELNQKISDAKESAAKLVADKQTKQNLVNDLQARLDAAEQLDRKAAVINSEIADMINRAKFYKNEIVKKQNSTSGIVDTTEHESRLKTLSDSLAGALVRQDEYKIALELLKDNGIKAGVIEKYIPVLNKKINELLDVIGFGVQLKFDEQFQETLVGRYADEFSYNSLSQGERERMNLAIMFAWNYLMGLSSGVDSNLLILDEIGMSALDADGVQSLFQLIENEYGDGNVFVISHNPEVQHLCRSAIKFVKKDGFVRML
jgi:DNA repair exonuclease SbcCD ATPase subunit